GILLPSVMLKHGELIFLDDKTVEEVASSLKVKIYPVANVEELIQTCVKELGVRS
ncbi:MAG: DUF512 domain-containing protein, partial [Cyanobacteria bacterium P01_C01_bin.38]